MAFDMGFDFRGSSAYVTDPAYGVPVLNDPYPSTYTNSNGYSLNAGWDSGVTNQDLDASNDVRLAGQNYLQNNGSPVSFVMDLSSGSNPGAGTYTLDMAFGHTAGGFTQSFQVKDNATVLIDASAGVSSSAAYNYVDATLSVVAANHVAWTGATVSKTFSSTTAKVTIGISSDASFTTLNHFRLTPSTATAFPWTYYATQMSA